MELSLTIFPQSSTVFEPTKGSLYNPSLWKNVECMEFIPLHYLYFCIKTYTSPLFHFFSGVSSVYEKCFHSLKILISCIGKKHFFCSESIWILCSSNSYHMRKSQSIYCNVSFNSWNLLSCIISFLSCCECILYTLCINDEKRRGTISLLIYSFNFYQFFLK
jgi:hypothetical protein